MNSNTSQCRAETRQGSRCSRLTSTGSAYCYQHQADVPVHPPGEGQQALNRESGHIDAADTTEHDDRGGTNRGLYLTAVFVATVIGIAFIVQSQQRNAEPEMASSVQTDKASTTPQDQLQESEPSRSTSVTTTSALWMVFTVLDQELERDALCRAVATGSGTVSGSEILDELIKAGFPADEMPAAAVFEDAAGPITNWCGDRFVPPLPTVEESPAPEPSEARTLTASTPPTEASRGELVLPGLGATTEDWESSHSQAPGFSDGLAYLPLIGSQPTYAAVFEGGNIMLYERYFPAGVSVDAQIDLVLSQELPPDSTPIDRFDRSEDGSCTSILYETEMLKQSMGFRTYALVSFDSVVQSLPYATIQTYPESNLDDLFC